MFYRFKRYYTYIIVTIFTLGLPFLTINGNHIFLLSFDKKQLQLLGIVFDMQELYLLPFLLMILFIGIFAITAIAGRAFCGWGCPQTIFRVIYRDLIETKLLKLRKKISNKQKDFDIFTKHNFYKYILGVLIWSLLALLASANFLWFFVPPEDFINYILDPYEHLILIGTWSGLSLFLIYDVIFLKEDFCVNICPYSRIQSVLYDEDTIQAIYSTNRGGNIYDIEKNKIVFKVKDLSEEENECTTCQKCVTVCPTHIDIRKGMQLECINCLECVDACSDVMGNLGKESLVQWNSVNIIDNYKKTNLFRPKTILYGVSLIIILIALLIMGSKKEYMLLNINKTTQLYKIKKNNIISNNFLFLFQNTDNKVHEYKIEIVGNFKDKISIKRFKSITLQSQEISKEIVILETDNILSKNKTKDTPIKIMLRAFAVDEPDRVFVLRELIFIYPRYDKLTK